MRRPGTIRNLDYYAEEGRVLATDCSAVKHLFWCNEPTGATTLLDSVGSVSISNATSPVVTQNVDRTVSLSAGFNTKTGDYASPGSKKITILSICKPALASSFQIGATVNTTTRGLKLSVDGLNRVCADPGNMTTETSTITSYTTLSALAVQANWGTALESYNFQGTILTKNTEVLTTATGITAVNTSAGLGLGMGFNPGFIVILHTINAIPESLMREMLVFMHSAFAAGKKVLHPAMRYL